MEAIALAGASLILLVADHNHNSLPAALKTLAWHRLHTTRLGLVGTPSDWLAQTSRSRRHRCSAMAPNTSPRSGAADLAVLERANYIGNLASHPAHPGARRPGRSG